MTSLVTTAFATVLLLGSASAFGQTTCLAQRDAILQQKAKVEAHLQSVQNFRAGLTDATVQQAAMEKADAAIAKDRDALARIAERLQLFAPAARIAEQINQTKRQLASLGFEERSGDFERLGQMSAAEQTHLKKDLIAQLQTLVIDGGKDAMEERFLGKIKKMKKRDVEALAEKLRKAGADDPIFQDWLRAFSPAASRKSLANGAQFAIKYVDTQQGLQEASEQLAPGTAEARQEAFLTMLSLVSDNPAVARLKAVAAGTYDIGEAGAYLSVLQSNVSHLDKITDDQLEQQKVLIKRMQQLVHDLRQACPAQ
jgi:hypothetical protein